MKVTGSITVFPSFARLDGCVCVCWWVGGVAFISASARPVPLDEMEEIETGKKLSLFEDGGDILFFIRIMFTLDQVEFNLDLRVCIFVHLFLPIYFTLTIINEIYQYRLQILLY